MSAHASARSAATGLTGSVRVQSLSFDPQTLRRLAYRQPADFPVLLDSTATGPLGRYSILAAYPQAMLWQAQSGAVFSQSAGTTTALQGGFLEALESAWQGERTADGGERDAGPFRGGWLVFLGYELAAEIEPKLALPKAAQSDAPAAFAQRCACALVYDHEQHTSWAVIEAGRPDLLVRLQAALASLPPESANSLSALSLTPMAEEPPELYRQRVRAALEAIRCGEVYQANLSRPWRTRLLLPVERSEAIAALYERLRRSNPAPFAALAQFQDWALLSSSPERLVRVQAGRIETRPIAGTRARSRQQGEDEDELAALIAHPKERAEHVMLIDLERNDLGRVCEGGSIRVDEFMVTETYAHVHHIVSSVSGRLRAEVTPVDVLRALMPGGTITGCPKFRCMQLIAELECEARGAYTGALGYINLDGSMDLNILIRTLTLQQDRIEFRAGAGIVADSDPERELAETHAKARGLLAALA